MRSRKSFMAAMSAAVILGSMPQIVCAESNDPEITITDANSPDEIPTTEPSVPEDIPEPNPTVPEKEESGIVFLANGGQFSDGSSEKELSLSDVISSSQLFMSDNFSSDGSTHIPLERFNGTRWSSMSPAEVTAGYDLLYTAIQVDYQIGHVRKVTLSADNETLLQLDGSKEMISWKGTTESDVIRIDEIGDGEPNSYHSKESASDNRYGYLGSVEYIYAKDVPAGYENPTLTDYIFTGWYMDPDTTTKWDGSTEDVTLYAGWDDAVPEFEEYDDPVDPETANVTYTFMSGTQGKSLPASVMAKLPAAETHTVGEVVTPSISNFDDIKEADGTWSFLGYNKKDLIVGENEIDNVFVGTWVFTEGPSDPTEKTSTISYRFNSGTQGVDIPSDILALLPASTTAAIGSTVQAANPSTSSVVTTDGTWTFNGYDKALLVVDENPNSNIFVGTWIFTRKEPDAKDITYTIRYCLMNTDGKTYTAETERTTGIAKEGTSITPTVKAFEGFASPQTQSYTIKPDTDGGTTQTINLLYTRNQYTLSYGQTANADLSNSSSAGTYYYGSDIRLVCSPAKGFSFVQWSTGSTNASDTIKMPAQNLQVTATVNATVYKITYNMDGGTASAGTPTEYTIESNAFNLVPPTRTGYTFAGWTGSNGSTPQMTVTVGKGTASNLTFTAHWIAGTTNTGTLDIFPSITPLPGTGTGSATSTDGSSTDTAENLTDVKTGDTAPILPLVSLLCIAFAGIIVIQRRRVR